jgi:hypothetical protein
MTRTLLNSVIVHIGPHKTGSSTIQSFCGNHRQLLETSGILYPPGHPIVHCHGQLGSAFEPNPASYVFNFHGGRNDIARIKTEDSRYISDFVAAIENSNANTMIVSYEGFFGLSKDALVRLRDFLYRFSRECKVLFYCRPPLDFARSELSQRARMGVRAFPEDSAADAEFPILTFEDNIPKFIDVFGKCNVISRKYDRKSLYQGDIVHDIFYTIGRHSIISDKYVAVRENKSISHEAMLIAECLRTMSDPSWLGNEFSERFDDLLRNISGHSITLSDHQRNVILSKSARHTKFIYNEFQIDLSDADEQSKPSHELFSEATLMSIARLFKQLIEKNRR